MPAVCFDKPQHIMYGNKCDIILATILLSDKTQHIMYGNTQHLRNVRNKLR